MLTDLKLIKLQLLFSVLLLRFHHPELFLFLLMTQIGNFGIKISPDNYSRVSKGHIKKACCKWSKARTTHVLRFPLQTPTMRGHAWNCRHETTGWGSHPPQLWNSTFLWALSSAESSNIFKSTSEFTCFCLWGVMLLLFLFSLGVITVKLHFLFEGTILSAPVCGCPEKQVLMLRGIFPQIKKWQNYMHVVHNSKGTLGQ